MDTGRLIIDSPAEGAWNMAVDEALLDSCRRTGMPTLRFYQWSKATLSLGYFQRHRDREQHVASRDCPLVRRSTGGRAIIHDQELTYSYIVPIADRLSQEVKHLYRLFHDSLVQSLSSWNITAERLTQVTNKGDPKEFLCFKRHTAGDVVIGKHKVAGSAQRRRQQSVLQHGSVLLQQSCAAPELPGIVDLTGISIAIEDLARSWADQMQNHLCIMFDESGLTDVEVASAERIRAGKFAASGWTKRR
ncbi:MAG: lipoate--protein ligase family protein [Planctomycetes bacterium]|nr:lipoate--protein ligase family protein [Planctomycetota bacterium]